MMLDIDKKLLYLSLFLICCIFLLTDVKICTKILLKEFDLTMAAITVFAVGVRVHDYFEIV